MALSIYVMPITGTGAIDDPRRPKYRDSVFPTLAYGMFDYGDEPQCLVGIVDIPVATDTTLTANADVFKVPSPTTTTVGATNTRNQIRNNLEASELPGNWVQTTTTYRQILLMVGACCQFAQRYQGLTGGRWFSGTVHVSSTFSTLTQAQQNGIVAAAQSFGFSTASMVPTAIIRDVLLDISTQYQAAQLPLVLAGVNLYTA